VARHVHGPAGRFTRPNARPNELADIRQQSFCYPADAGRAAAYLLADSGHRRDAYFGAHLFRARGNRLTANASATVRCLWLDEDGATTRSRPEPTAIVHSSATRRHLYWRLSQRVAIEWAVAMNRRIAAWANGDTGKAGAASVLRVPATLNYKKASSG
jgi:hypothetical protein